MMKTISFFTGLLVGLVLPWYIKNIQKIPAQEIESDMLILEQEDIDWLEAVAAMYSPQPEVMAPHKPRVGVWVAEDALTGVPYVRQNGEWVQIGRDY
jgi:hypothetical protein